MMKRIALLLLLLPTAVLADGTLFVQSAKAKVMASPAFSGDVVATLGKGTQVSVLETDGRWVKVQAAGNSGWISRFLLSDEAPLDRITVLEGEANQEIESNARRRASTVTTAGATRSLTAGDRARASKAGITDYQALHQMETLQLEETAVMNFLSNGLAAR